MYKSRDRDSDSDFDTLLVVNARSETMGDLNDLIVDFADGYDGEVYRIDFFDDSNNLGDFHSTEADLEASLTEFYPDSVAWYDDAFILGHDGLDDVDCKDILREGKNLDIVGGALTDIALVVDSIEQRSRNVSYNLREDLVFDHFIWQPGWNDDFNDELASLSELLTYDNFGTIQRLESLGLAEDNVFY